MADQAILLVHGMGVHPGPTKRKKGSFCKEFIAATTKSLRAFKKHKRDSLGKHVDIHEFNYDDWLNHVRETMAKKSNSMRDRLDDICSHYGVSVPIDFVGKLVSFESRFGDEEFFCTHWLDVLFYGSMLGAKIRVDAGLKVAELVQKYGSGNVHIIAHSLGTAVMHDTLDRLYRPESDPNDGIPDLDPANNRLGSIWMIANVSRLVNSVTRFSDPYKSIVKPGNDGCTNSFVNVRHELDPITWLAQFNPANNGEWLDPVIYSDAYENVVTNLVVDGNTHSFVQYLQDPGVTQRLLPRFVPGLDTTMEEFNAIAVKYAKKSINGAYAALEETFSEISITDKASWREFLDAAKALKTIADKIKTDLA